MQIKLILTILLFVLYGCKSNSKKVLLDHSKLRLYSQTPAFIKTYLDSTSTEKVFLIAEPGEDWNSGCVTTNDNVPRCQFISGRLYKNQYEMKLRTGGFVLSDQVWLINFKDQQVTSILKLEEQ